MLKALDVPLPGIGTILLPAIKQQSAASLRDSDLGLDTSLTDIPHEATLVQLAPLPPITSQIELTSMDIVLYGTALSGKSFMRNPTSCGTKTTRFDANSYADEDTFIHGSASYNSTGCEDLPFHPAFSATLGAPGETGPGTPTQATTAIKQGEDEAGLKRAQVDLPQGLGATNAALNRGCPEAKFNAGTCPATSIVGSATAASPLLAQSLQGPVILVSPAGPGLPQIGLDLRGPLPLKLTGKFAIGQTAGVVFDGLPDIPISNFQLHFNGAPTLSLSPRATCARRRPRRSTRRSTGTTGQGRPGTRAP